MVLAGGDAPGMHVLLAASEFHPYSKTGGLADAVAALGRWLARDGIEVTVVTPYYRTVRQKSGEMESANWRFAVPLGGSLCEGSFRIARPEPNLTVWFVDQPEFFDRAELYNQGIADYPDNADRFALFAKAAVLVAKHHPNPPDIIHCHDWQAGLIPLLVQHGRVSGIWRGAPRTLFSIHNLAYQGWFPASSWALTDLPEKWFHLESASHHGKFNFLKSGLCLSDALATVSPTYAAEITTPEFGCGLEGLLRRRRADLRGILNGVDYSEWKTQGNPALPFGYDISNLEGKAANKRTLQAEMGLPEAAGVPLISNISRLTWQKGSDLLIEAVSALMAEEPFQFIALGNGDPPLEAALRELAAKLPERVGVRIGFDSGLAHRIEAGSDFFVMPSRFEPCGLNQMYSLRYGTPPLVRATGGLDDSVVDPREDVDRTNGIKFEEASTEALIQALRKALALYAIPEAYSFFQRNAMSADFSWARQVQDYVAYYQEILQLD